MSAALSAAPLCGAHPPWAVFPGDRGLWDLMDGSRIQRASKEADCLPFQLPPSVSVSAHLSSALAHPQEPADFGNATPGGCTASCQPHKLPGAVPAHASDLDSPLKSAESWGRAAACPASPRPTCPRPAHLVFLGLFLKVTSVPCCRISRLDIHQGLSSDPCSLCVPNL